MKIENLKLKINSRGEIATVLTLISVGLMLAGILAGTKIAQNSTEQRTQAQNAKVRSQSSTLSGCQIVDTDNGPGCWCAKPDPGVWQFHCFSGATRGTPASTACTNNCTALNTGGGGGGGGAGDGTGTPTDGKSCSLSSLSPDVGDCGSCILGKSPGTKDFITSNTGATGCLDNQIASFWCNGGVSEDGKNQCQNLKSQCLAEKACTGKPITSPSPTGADGKGGGGGGGGDGENTPTPDSRATFGKYVVVSKDSLFSTTSNSNTDYSNLWYQPISGNSKLNFITSSSDDHIAENDVYDQSQGTTKSCSHDNSVETCEYHLQNNIIREIKQKTSVDTLTGVFKIYDNTTLRNYLQDYKTCNPYGKIFLEDTPVPNITKENLVKKCSTQINTLNIDLDNPQPTPSPASVSFTVNINNPSSDDHLFAQFQNVTIFDGTDNFSPDLTSYNQFLTGPGGYSRSIILKSKPLKSTTGSLIIGFDVHLFYNVPVPTETGTGLYKREINITGSPGSPCTISGQNITRDQATGSNDLGELFDLNITQKTDEPDPLKSYTCEIKPVENLSNKHFLGSANVDFDNTMAKWKSGEIDATQMSSFINQLTRTPGLQVTFCDPAKGECSPTF